MIDNFRKASVTPEKHKARLEAMNEDVIRLMTEGGVDAIQAEPKFKMNLAKLVRESVEDEFALTDPTAIFTERRTASLGDKIEVERKHNTLRVVKYSPQSQPLIFSPVKSKHTLSTTMYELAYGIQLIQVMTRQHTIQEFVQYAAQALTKHALKVVLTAIDTACGVGATDQRGRALRTVAAGADVTKTELDAALRRMGPGTRIFGARWALEAIMDFAQSNGGDNMKEEWIRRGFIGTYRGASLVSFEDDFDAYKQAFTSVNGVDLEKLIFIAAPQKGAIYLERDLNALQWSELDSKTATFEAGLRLDHGVFVDKPWRYHVIKLA